jgi:hypothetical protein
MSKSFLQRHFYVATYVVNILMLPVFLACFCTGVLMFPGFLDLVGVRARNFPMETVASIHDWTGLGLGFGILFHLFLHWRPFLQFVKNKILHVRPRSNRRVSEEVDPLEV